MPHFQSCIIRTMCALLLKSPFTFDVAYKYPLMFNNSTALKPGHSICLLSNDLPGKIEPQQKIKAKLVGVGLS